VENIQVWDNRLQLTAMPGGENGLGLSGIGMIVGDTATDWYNPTYQPITYPEGNYIRNVSVEGNSIEGPGSAGISVSLGWGGDRQNAIQDVYIRNNTISHVGFGTLPTYGVYLTGGQAESPVGHQRTGENQMANVVVEQNTISLAPAARNAQSGGVSVQGGEGAQLNKLSGIWIARNDIDPGGLVGVNVIGGILAGDLPALNNTVSHVEVWCNSVRHMPDRNTPGFDGLKGVTVIGGDQSQGNRVEQVRLVDNLIAGRLDDYVNYFVTANYGSLASGNTVQVLQGRSGAAQPSSSAGVLNAPSLRPSIRLPQAPR
jgi:hypothetical protein